VKAQSSTFTALFRYDELHSDGVLHRRLEHLHLH
jgi:hypothetical protein